MLKGFLLIGLLFVSNLAIANWAEQRDVDLNPPEVTRDQVEALFGQRLENADRAESLLLLAIALESSSSKANHSSNNIGIPWIVGESAGYWALLLKQGDRRVDVLVNNALLLMFSQGSNPSRALRLKGSKTLLEQAADFGYWPAQAFLGELLIEELSQPYQRPNSLDFDRSQKFEQAFNYLKGCAKAGYAACHFKLGFWYASVGQVEAAEPLFKAGLELIRRDRRYLSSDIMVTDALDVLDLLTQTTVPNDASEARLYSSFKQSLNQTLTNWESNP